MDFNNTQKHSLLSKMGYSGPAEGPAMEAFIQSSPGVAARMGKFTKALQKRTTATGQTTAFANGGPVSGYAAGGFTVAYTGGGRDGPMYSVIDSTGKKVAGPSPNKGAMDKIAADRNAAPKTDTPKTDTPKTDTPKTDTPKTDTGTWVANGYSRTVVGGKTVKRPLAKNTKNGTVKTGKADETVEAFVARLNTPSTETPATPSPGTTLADAAVQDPTKLVTAAEVDTLEVNTPGALLDKATGQIEGTTEADVTTVDSVEAAAAPTVTPAALVDASTAAGAVAEQVAGVAGEQGTVSDAATVDAAQGKLSPSSLAEAATFDPNFLDKVSTGEYTVGSEELVTPAGQTATAIKANIAQSDALADAVAVTGVVQANELPAAAQIKESDMAQAVAITNDRLTDDATVVAAKLSKFTVDDGTLAEAMQGKVGPLDTVQGQLAALMKDFDDGTPAWAAGAVRAANAVMASRGLGGSSMAGAAIVQAAMESAIPIASQDAQFFQQMNLTNLDNKQKVALTNAAAQQGLQLQNLSNEQQARLQNSANAFSLQSQNLSNMQSVVLANAQIKATLQGQNLNNQQQANLVTAARYAEMANINLNNLQQTALQNNSNELQVNLANLSAKQQAYVVNAQLAAALQGQQIDTAQQAAISNAARFAEAANIEFTAKQQTKLHNSTLMQTIGLANLDAEQAAVLQNAANLAQMDVANLSNRQQAAVQNAQAFLQMDMANLDNNQQATMFRAQSNVQALFTDQAAVNAAKQFNAASENQTNQFFADLSSRVSMFNSEQKNAMAQFNAGEVNATGRFNAQLEAQRKQFNASSSLVIAQANAQWRQSVATTNTAAQNEANMEVARTANAMTAKAMDEVWQKERDTMAYAFTAIQSELDRNQELLLADKKEAAAESGARAGFFYNLLSKAINPLSWS